MAHFTFDALPVPTVTAYPFEADLVVSIVPPQEFTCVPTRAVSAYIHWSKDADTDDTNNDLYTEIYRSVDLINWELIITRQWLNYDYYTDTNIGVGKKYYYRLRFVRITHNVITKVSNNTVPVGIKTVSLLGFEPRDQYSNKFFQWLQQSLPGTRIYDRTNSATFSSTEFQLWQTTCKILEGFDLSIDGSVAHTEPADPTALYAKRDVSFFLDNKQSQITSLDDQGTVGDIIQVNNYLIHTILQSYAEQFMQLYTNYFQLVTDKNIDSNQIYTKGFLPLVTTQKEISTADLWYAFGSLLNLQPVKAQDTDQGLVRYKQMLQDSFGNIDKVAERQGILDACSNVLGITTQYLLEYHKQHFFKSDREAKIYIAPSSSDTYGATIDLSIANTTLDYVLNNTKYWASVVYTFDDTPTTLPTLPEGAVYGILGTNVKLIIYSDQQNSPDSYLFVLYLTSGVTTANNIIDVLNVQNVDPVTSLILTVANASGNDGTGVINDLTDHSGVLLRAQSRYVTWENTNIHLYDKLYTLKDNTTATTVTDSAAFSCTVSHKDPTVTLLPSGTGSQSTFSEQGQWGNMDSHDLIAVRDDNIDNTSVGISYNSPTVSDITLVGTKHILFTVPLTTTDTSLITKAFLNLFVNHSSQAGYLKLYRLRTIYDSSVVSWSFSKEDELSNGYELDYLTGEYVSLATSNWVLNSWDVASTDNAQFLKDVYVPQVDINTPAWISINITDILQQVYKYETSNLDLGTDPENLNSCGFMLTMEAFSDKSFLSIKGNTDSANREPNITYDYFAQGFYQVPVDTTTFLYIDGTTRYDRLLVKDSVTEPIPYNVEVNEIIRQADIKFLTPSTVTILTTVSEFIVGSVLYGETSKAVGTIISIVDKTISLQVTKNNFVAGETITVLNYILASASSIIDTVIDSQDLYIEVSRTPVLNANVTTYHSGTETTATTPPSTYPAYSVWTEAGDGILPVFTDTTLSSTLINNFAIQDVTNTRKILLNTSSTRTEIKDVHVTYTYLYEYVLLGKVTCEDYITNIEACNRLDTGLFTQRENDHKFQSELMLPEALTAGINPDINGDTTVDEYSDFNLSILSDAVSNVRRFNGQIDVFKYNLIGKKYRFGQAYHTFFKRK